MMGPELDEAFELDSTVCHNSPIRDKISLLTKFNRAYRYLLVFYDNYLNELLVGDTVSHI